MESLTEILSSQSFVEVVIESQSKADPEGNYMDSKGSMVASSLDEEEEKEDSSVVLNSSSQIWNEVRCSSTSDPKNITRENCSTNTSPSTSNHNSMNNIDFSNTYHGDTVGGAGASNDDYDETNNNNNLETFSLSQEERDRALAQKLQETFDMSFERKQQARDTDENLLRTTCTGKALHFVTQMISNHDAIIARFIQEFSIDNSNTDHPALQFKLVNVDDMVFLAEKVFAMQELFGTRGKDTHVDIGYHYTNSSNMERIRTNGLMSNAERNARRVANGNIFGDGIYTANNMFSYHNFGGSDQGLLVARLKGTRDIVQEPSNNHIIFNTNGPRPPPIQTTADTVIGREGETDEVCVLQTSKQCIALVQYDSSIVSLNNDSSVGNQLVYEYHRSVQKIVDECFNDGITTNVIRYFPSRVTIRTLLTPLAALQKSVSTLSPTLRYIVYYTAPDSNIKADLNIRNEAALLRDLVVDQPIQPMCGVCKKSLTGNGPVGFLPRCCHEFHLSCLPSLLKRHSRKCPCCGNGIGDLSGKLPRHTLWMDPRNNPHCLVVRYRPGLTEDNADRKNAVNTKHESWARHVTYLPPSADNRSQYSPPKFLFACGTTFDMMFSKKGDNGESVPLRWSNIFDNTVILKRLRKAAEKHCKKCNTCRKSMGRVSGKVPIGLMPTGTMRIDKFPDVSCEGYDRGTIVITYRFERGIQKDYHDNPGQEYIPTYRVAYVPSNEDGVNLVKRLRFAFARGFTFEIGKSLTTGVNNSIIWSSIPHKTSLTAGEFGYPDPQYFTKTNEELDVLGIPKAEDL